MAKSQLKKTIFADIKVIPQETKEKITKRRNANGNETD